MFKTKNKLPIGLDISDLSLKISQLKKRGDKIKIQALGKVLLKPADIVNGEIKNEEVVIKAIKNLMTNPNFGFINNNQVVACLPDAKTFIKTIEVFKSPNKLENVIPTEVSRHIPLLKDEMYFDWQIINQDHSQYTILVGAAPKNIVDQYITTLKKAGLDVVALEIESVALCRALLKNERPKFTPQEKQNFGIIDIGANRTSFTIYADSTIVTSVSMPLSGEELTLAIAKTLEIKRDQAEKAKIICGLDKSKAQGIIHDILYDMIKKLNTKLTKTITFYQENFAQLGDINKIFVCGGGSNIKNIDKIIEEKIKIKTNLGDVFTNINQNAEDLDFSFTETHSLDQKIISGQKNKKLSSKQSSALSYATAIGLSLRGAFNIDEIF